MRRRKLLRQAEVLRVRPGDVIAYRAAERLSPEEMRFLGAQLQRVFPNNEVGVLVGGSLQIVRPTQERDAA